MKTYTLALALLMILFIGACKKDSTTTGAGLKGKWKVTGHMVSAAGPMYYVPQPTLNEPQVVQFNSNGTVIGNIFSEYPNYKIKDSVTVTLTKADKTTYQNYYYKIQGDSLTMSPAGPIYCTEGCAVIFHKLKSGI